MKKTLCMIVMVIFFSNQISLSQSLKQTIKGQVVDKQSQSPVPGVNVVIQGTMPLIGAITDGEGYFKLENCQVGRASLQFSFVGYQSQTLGNLVVSSGKELVLMVELEEMAIQTEEIEVKASKEKLETINDMVTLSGRTFTIEESQRYAGARNDVARMASNYAGVGTSDDTNNSIVIRGNSPDGLLWRYEDVDIPNPNHFGFMGSTSGPVSMLNNNVLSNSDFLTAAFPAEYGNALSGVFDLKMRSGNYEKHEFVGQVGFNGFELGAEGPISKANHSSYLINYRYSTLALMYKMGLKFPTGTAIPYYQDICFKLNFPLKKYGKITLFGLGGKSEINFNRSKQDSTDLANDDFNNGDYAFDLDAKSKMGVLGLSNTLIWDNSTYSKLTLAATVTNTDAEIDSIIPFSKNTMPYTRADFTNNEWIASGFINKKFSSHYNFKIGASIKTICFNLVDSSYFSSVNRFMTQNSDKGSTVFAQAFAQFQYKYTDNLIFNAGLYSQFLALNKQNSFEPRLGIKWQLTPYQSISFGYGLHERMQPVYLYFMRPKSDFDNSIRPNKNLGFTKSHHLVTGYSYNFSNYLRFKAEGYYQYSFNTVVTAKDSYFSMVNHYDFSQPIAADSLTNGGTSDNYGIEITFEKFLNNDYYFLLTTSLFDSKYKGSNGIERPTAFDGHYVINFLAGKDFQIFKNQKGTFKHWITIDSKITTAGGKRYTPIDYERSIKEKITVYDESHSFSKQFSAYFRADIRLGYRIDGKHASQELVFDIQNITNHKNPLYLQYDRKTGQESFVYQLGFFPMFQYRIVF